MAWIVDNYRNILLVSGLLTLSMLQFAVMPGRAQRSTFGEALEGPLAEVIVRGWGVLIGLTGGMLVWAAFHPETRPMAVTVAVLGKAFFIAALLAQGRRFLKGFSGASILIDAVVIVLLAAGLPASRPG